MAGPPTPCLDADAAAAYAAHALTDDERAIVDAHIDGCASCRQLVSAVALAEHTAETSPSQGHGIGLVLPKGARIGPYEIERPLDAGGMGLVYVAHDTRLQRKVAIKGVREHRISEHHELLREATAMARLSHPNVVHVFDVIEAWDQTFFAMELVVGSSARQWLEAKKRTPAQIIDVLLQAGTGIAAAHAAGLVHRDVKPANILVGDDGRVRITDFGIASASSDDTPDTVRGTPAYMAPEVAAGLPSDEKSDQFSFAVMLHQALSDVGPVAPPLAKILQRAKEKDPAARFPTMNALLDAIRATQRKSWRVAIAAAVVLLLIGLAAAFFIGRAQQQAEACARPPPQLLEFWDESSRAEVKAAFEKTKAPWAADAFARVETAVQGWVDRFTRVRRQSCEATWLERQQSPEILTAQMRCLSARAREARATVDELRVADTAVVSDPVGATWQLSRLDACLEVNTPAPPETPEHAAVREKLAVARARSEAGRNKESLAAASEALALAEALKDDDLKAESLLRVGIGQTRTSAFDKASESLKQSLHVADAAGDDKGRAQASMQLMANEFWQGHFDQVLFLGDLTIGATERAHDENLTADVLMMMGASLAERDQPEASQKTFERCLKIRLRLFGEKDRKVAAVYSALGNLRSMRGELNEGLELHRKSLAIMKAAVGDVHPMLGRQYFNTGADLMAMREPKKAELELKEGLRILEAAQGPSHRDVASASCELGGAQLALGEHDAAVASLERGEALWAKLSPKNPKRGACIATLSRAKPVPLELLEVGVTINPKADSQFALAQALSTPRQVPERALELARAARTQWAKSKLPSDHHELETLDAWFASHGVTP